MKNRILTFVIGVLTGAIITTLIFIIINPFNGRGNAPEGMVNKPPEGQFGERPERPNGEMGEPPAKPEGNMQMP